MAGVYPLNEALYRWQGQPYSELLYPPSRGGGAVMLLSRAAKSIEIFRIYQHYNTTLQCVTKYVHCSKYLFYTYLIDEWSQTIHSQTFPIKSDLRLTWGFFFQIQSYFFENENEKLFFCCYCPTKKRLPEVPVVYILHNLEAQSQVPTRSREGSIRAWPTVFYSDVKQSHLIFSIRLFTQR